MANETKIGGLTIDLQAKTQAWEKGLETAKKKLQEMEQENTKIQTSNKNLDASFIAMSAGIVASLVKIKSAVDDGIQKYKEFESANKGLESIVKGQGLSFGQAQSFIKEYISDGLIPLSDATLAYKNLAARGYSEDQIKKTMLALKDAAAFGRQSTYEYGQAIATATEGLKNENSILVDNAGVTKNVAKMWEDYAKSIGKTKNDLTQQEKIQAEVNGIIEESKNQVGDAAKYAETYAGKQAQLNAANIELSKNIGESMIPVLSQFNNIVLSISKGLASFTSNNKTTTTGIITLTTSVLATVGAVLAIKKAILAYTTATGVANTVTQTFTASLMSNPLFIGGLAISAGITALNIFISKQQESIDKLNEMTEKSKQLQDALDHFNKDKEYTEGESAIVKQQIEESNQIINAYENRNKRIEELNNEIDKLESKKGFLGFGLEGNEPVILGKYKDELQKLTKEQEKANKEMEENHQTIDKLKNKVKTLTNTLDQNSAKQDYNTLMNTKANREQLISIAQTISDIQNKKKLFEVLKQGKTGTEQYKDAQKQLVKIYPELANVNENTIKSTQNLMDAEEEEAQKSWKLRQETIQSSIAELEALNANKVKVGLIAIATGEKIDDIKKKILDATEALKGLANLTSDDLSSSIDTTNYTYTPPKSSSSSSSSSYSNKKLDNYKELIEYKKSMDKISTEEEIKMYQKALDKYAKTTKEKRELRVKLHELEKQTLDDYVAKIEHKSNLDKISTEKELKQYKKAYKEYAKTKEQKWQIEEKIYDLEQQALDDYMSKIEHKNSLDKLSTEKQIELYKTALNEYAKTKDQKWQIEEKLYELELQKLEENLKTQVKIIENSMKEKEKIEGASYAITNRQEDYDNLINIHWQYLNEVLNNEKISSKKKQEIYKDELEVIKSYEEEKRNLMVKSIDDTVSNLTNAIIKNLNEMENAEKEAIQRNIELVEKWKDERINAINEEYNARIKAIQEELDLLDKSEQEKTRAEEDAEYERKRNRLQELIDFEHDLTNRANYEKELDKLNKDYQKKLDKRNLDDKKEALKEEENLLKEQQKNEVKKIEDEADSQKEIYENQLDYIEKYYDEQQKKAKETAEKMLLNVEQNQNQILSLLQGYGDDYELTGQSLGEKLAQGINNGIVGKIEDIIHTIQRTIDTNIENKIASWTSSGTQVIGNSGITTSSKSINVTQNNYIQQNPEMPSEAYRKLRNINEALASELSGV